MELYANTSASPNMDSDNDESVTPLLQFFNNAVAMVAVVIVICDIMAVVVLNRCRRIPYQTRYLSVNFIISDAFGSLILFICQVLMFWFKMNNKYMENVRVTLVGMMASVTMVSMAALSFDRLYALKASLTYGQNLTKFKLICFIGCIWLFHITIYPLVIVDQFSKECDSIFNNCNFWGVTKTSRTFNMACMILAGVGLSISYCLVLRIAGRHQRAINSLRVNAFNGDLRNPDYISERQFSATLAILKIVFAFIILYTPLYGHFILLETNMLAGKEFYRRVIYAFSYICIQINSFVSLRLYVAQFKECKLVLYQFLGKIFKFFDSQVENLRVDVYNIVLLPETEQSNRNKTISVDVSSDSEKKIESE